MTALVGALIFIYMADKYGLKEDDPRIGLLDFIATCTSLVKAKTYISLPLDVLKDIVKDLGVKAATATTASTTTFIASKRRVASPQNAQQTIPELPESPCLADYDKYKEGVVSLCIGFPDTSSEELAIHMRHMMAKGIRGQLELLATTKLEVPTPDPEEARDFLEHPYRAVDASHKASIPMRMEPPPTGDHAGTLPRDKSSADGSASPSAEDRWAHVRVVRFIDCPAAILQWVLDKYAVVEEDRVEVYWKQYYECKLEGGDVDALMNTIEDAVRQIKVLTKGVTDLSAWNRGNHMALRLMNKLSGHPQITAILFQDGCRDWAVIRGRARSYAARLRIQALSAPDAEAAYGVQQQRAKGGGSMGQGGKGKGGHQGQGGGGGQGGQRQQGYSKARSKSRGPGKRDSGGEAQKEKCSRCGGNHPLSACKTDASVVCFNCDQAGHKRMVCPQPKKALAALQVGSAEAAALAVSTKDCYAIIDAGASTNCVTTGWLKQQGASSIERLPLGSGIQFQTAGSIVMAESLVNLVVMWLAKPRVLEFFVLETDSLCPPLIGMSTLKEYGITASFREGHAASTIVSTELGETMQAQERGGVMTARVFLGLVRPSGGHPGLAAARAALRAADPTVDKVEVEAPQQLDDVAELSGAPLVHSGLLDGFSEEELRGLITHYHQQLAHPGYRTTFNSMVRLGLSPSLRRSHFSQVVRDVVANCATCAAVHERAGGEVAYAHGGLQASAFNECVSVDTVQYQLSGRGATWALTLVDDATNYRQAVVLKSKHPTEVVRGLMTVWVGHFGKPKFIRHDAGGEFAGAFHTFCKVAGIGLRPVPVGHHQSNGRAEGWHPMLHAAIRGLAKDTQLDPDRDWDLLLSDAVAALNRRASSSGGPSPAAQVLRLGILPPGLSGEGGGG